MLQTIFISVVFELKTRSEGHKLHAGGETSSAWMPMGATWMYSCDFPVGM
jgi:hypothetical protein